MNVAHVSVYCKCVLLQAELFKAYIKGQIVFNKDNLEDTDEATFEFSLGEHVVATRRKVAPLNEEGGVAIITGRRVFRRNALYDIKYVLRKHVEVGISAPGVLSKYDIDRPALRHASTPKSGANNLCPDSASIHFYYFSRPFDTLGCVAGSSSSLEDLLAASDERRLRDIAALQSALNRETSRRRELGKQLKELTAREQFIRAERNQIQIEQQASGELMNRRCLELLEEETTQAVTLAQQQLLTLEMSKIKATQAEKQRDFSKKLSVANETRRGSWPASSSRKYGCFYDRRDCRAMQRTGA